MIHVDHVSRSYGDLRAVDDVSFDVQPGEIVALLGPNGAGKSTVLRMIATLIRPDAGTITVHGHDVVADSTGVRTLLGYQTGDTGLYARLSPIEFLSYFAALHEVPPPLAAERIARLVERFDMGDFAKRPCGGLSTGQKQRVVLARTLVHDPPVLVLDEPTSGLDVLSSAFILDAIRGLAAEGRAVLFSTHILSEVELLCDRVVVIHRGRRIAEDTVDGLMSATQATSLSRAFLQLVHAADEAA